MSKIIIADAVQKINPLTRWREHKLISREMSERMRRAGLIARADRMAQCGAQLDVSICADCGRIHINRANLCRDKLCPTCQWRLSLKRFADLYRVLSVITERNPDARFAMMTLTVQNCKLGELSQTIKIMSESINRVFNRKTVKPYIAGWARALEITHNPQSNTWHPHYHLILYFNNETSQAIVGDYILQSWIDSCPLITSIEAQDIRDIYDKELRVAGAEDVVAKTPALIASVCEVLKYATKTTSLMELTPATLKMYALQVANKRLVSYGGEIAQIRRDLRMDDELPEDRSGSECVCLECGSPNLTQMLLIWSAEGAEYVPLQV